MSRKLFAAAAPVAAALANGPAAQATVRTDTYSYVAGPGDLTIVNCDGSLKVTETGFGGTCFDVWRGDTTVSIVADDAAVENVSVTFAFQDPAGETIGDFLQFCGASGVLTIPTGAATVITYVDTALAATSPCGGTPGTTGTLSATFS